MTRLLIAITAGLAAAFTLCLGADAWAGPKLHIYGNWCGPGVGNRSTKKPVDAVDRACMLHDKCYLRKGSKGPGGLFQHCDCDRLILRELRKTRGMKLKRKARRKRALMIAYFKLARCWCRKRVCRKVLRCSKKRKCKKKRGKKKCKRALVCRRVRKCSKKVRWGRGGRRCN